MMNFQKTDKWTHTNAENGIVILIKRHYTFNKENAWCLYIVIHENSNLFKLINCDDYREQEFILQIPFHNGCTYHQPLTEKGEVFAHKIGCDYFHSNDEHFKSLSKREEVPEVFEDAQELYDWAITKSKSELSK